MKVDFQLIIYSYFKYSFIINYFKGLFQGDLNALASYVEANPNSASITNPATITNTVPISNTATNSNAIAYSNVVANLATNEVLPAPNVEQNLAIQYRPIAQTHNCSELVLRSQQSQDPPQYDTFDIMREQKNSLNHELFQGY